MAIFSKQAFSNLAQSQEQEASSFYIPSLKSGDNDKARIIFKNQIQSIKKKMEAMKKGENYINGYTEPLYKILDDVIFWRHLSDGLAIFHSMKTHEKYSVPITFEAFHHLGNQFYLLPMISYFNGNGRFYILNISLNKTMLYEGSRDEIGRIHIEDQIPGSLEDSVGYDYQQKNLQFRTNQTGSNEAHFHGHGAGKDDKDKEIMQFLRAVEKGFIKIAGKSGKPLIVASVDDIFSKYKQINTYQNLHEKNISGNPDDLDTIFLHEKAWELLKNKFSELQKRAKDDYDNNQRKGTTSNDIRKIVYESLNGNIETLFVRKKAQIWGSYNHDKPNVKVDDQQNSENECLIDKSSKATFLQGGNVFIENKEEMPDKTSPINAIFRIHPK
ncbi:MAG: hypothetical protein KQI35_19060 [Bacteroidetes bacterium]|nr:hypothetical protein [Bacteroidota bacterium]